MPGVENLSAEQKLALARAQSKQVEAQIINAARHSKKIPAGAERTALENLLKDFSGTGDELLGKILELDSNK